MSLQDIGLEAVFSTKNFEKGLGDYLSGLGKAEGKTNIVASALGTIGKVAGGLAVAGIGAAAGAFGMALKSGTDMNTMLEKTTLQFTTLMGDSDKAKQHVQDLFKFAAKTPFETEPILQASKNLLTFGGAALDTNENLQLVGDAAAAVNAPIDEVSFWVGRAYSMMQAGKPFGEAAMRLQEMGILTAGARDELEKMQASGKKGPEVWGAFQKSIGKFSGAMELQANTWEGLTSTISDNLKMAAATAMKPFFDLAKEGLGWLATFVQSEQFTTWAQGVASWLGTNLPIAINFLVNAWQGVLWPALQAVWGWMQTSLFPTLATIYNWLAVNLPPAIAAISAFWSGVLWPALVAVFSWIQANVIPVLLQIWNWLAVNLPPAIAALAAFWQGTLLPAITAVGNWISTVLIPILSQIFTWLSVNVPLAINTLVAVWQGILYPALMLVWGFINNYIVPILQALGEIIGQVLEIAVTIAAGVWQNVLLPALTAVWNFIQSKISPILKSLGDFLGKVFNPVIETTSNWIGQTLYNSFLHLCSILESVRNWLEDLKRRLSSLKLPAWMTPGSPTPWEIGLVGVNEALKDVTGQLPALQLQLDRTGANAPYVASQASPGFTPAANVTTNNNVFNLGGQTINNGWDAASLRMFIVQTVQEAL